MTRTRKGAKSKKTAANVATILKAIREGLSLKSAAALARIDESTLHLWRRQDKSFAAQVEQACAESEQELLKLAMEGAKKDGRIALMMLERRFPESWRKRETVSGRVEHLHAHATVPTELLQMLQEQRRIKDAALTAGQIEPA